MWIYGFVAYIYEQITSQLKPSSSMNAQATAETTDEAAGALVLLLVRRWQRESWQAWADALSARSCCRAAFTQWAQVAGILPPPLVDSSSGTSEDLVLIDLERRRRIIPKRR